MPLTRCVIAQKKLLLLLLLLVLDVALSFRSPVLFTPLLGWGQFSPSSSTLLSKQTLLRSFPIRFMNTQPSNIFKLVFDSHTIIVLPLAFISMSEVQSLRKLYISKTNWFDDILQAKDIVTYVDGTHYCLIASKLSQAGQHLCIFITDSSKDVEPTVADENVVIDGSDQGKQPPPTIEDDDLEISPLTILAAWNKKIGKDSISNAYRSQCRILFCRRGHVIEISPFLESENTATDSDVQLSNHFE